jgi:hypothetical protein
MRQIKNTIHCNYLHLKNYQLDILTLIDNFQDFNIIDIPWVDNKVAYSLDTNTFRLTPLEDFEARTFSMELLYRPSLPNNFIN